MSLLLDTIVPLEYQKYLFLSEGVEESWMMTHRIGDFYLRKWIFNDVVFGFDLDFGQWNVQMLDEIRSLSHRTILSKKNERTCFRILMLS